LLIAADSRAAAANDVEQRRAKWSIAVFLRCKKTQVADAVEKGFSVPERRRIFQERLPVENIDSNISYLGFYYCPSWRVRRSLIDFFNSIDPNPKSRLSDR